MGKQFHSELEKLVASEVSALGFEFIRLEYISHSKSSVLRVYVNAVNGITLNDCGKISYHLNKVLSVTNSLKLGEYVLEVSSPGIG